MSSPNPAPSPSPDPETSHHVVVNLDQELLTHAVVECLELASDLQQNPEFYRVICPQLLLRLSYVLLHGEAPEYRREELRRLGLHHNRLATSLLASQQVLGNLPAYLRRSRGSPSV